MIFFFTPNFGGAQPHTVSHLCHKCFFNDHGCLLGLQFLLVSMQKPGPGHRDLSPGQRPQPLRASLGSLLAPQATPSTRIIFSNTNQILPWPCSPSQDRALPCRLSPPQCSLTPLQPLGLSIHSKPTTCPLHTFAGTMSSNRNHPFSCLVYLVESSSSFEAQLQLCWPQEASTCLSWGSESGGKAGASLSQDWNQASWCP